MPFPMHGGPERQVVIGLAEFAVSSAPEVVLATYALGSCLGISIYDPLVQVGGLLHAMLPDSTVDPAKAAERPGVFVDTGWCALLRAAKQLRADPRRMLICVAGGAQILDSEGWFEVGEWNHRTLLRALQHDQLRITAEQVGGSVNRTMYLGLRTGQVILRVAGEPGQILLCPP